MSAQFNLRQLGPDGLRRALDEQRKQDDSTARKQEAMERVLIDEQRHKHLIRAHICRHYKNLEIRNDILIHVDGLKNLLRQVSDQVAVAYDRAPSRSLRGVDSETERKFLAAYREAEADVVFGQVNRQCFYLGVVFVLPRIEDGRLTLTTVTPDIADVLFDPAGAREPAILVYESHSHGARHVAVDAERWWWLDKDWQIVAEEEHGLGQVPWVEWRWRPRPRGDYWDRGQGSELQDGTLEIGRIWAHTKWVRKHNSKKLAHIHAGENVAIPEGQNASANQPMFTRGEGEAEITVHDLIVPVGEFIAEMRELTESVLESYGLPVNLVDFSTASTQDAANAFTPAGVNKQAALDRVRSKSIASFDASEGKLAIRIAALLRSVGRLSLTEEQVRESFRCRYAQLTWADHPKERMGTAKAQMELGQTDPYELYCAENPGVTYAEAVEYVDAHVEARAKFYQHYVQSGLPLDPADDLKTPAQLAGKLGGMTRAENANAEQQESESA